MKKLVKKRVFVKKLVNGKMKKGKYLNGIYITFDQIDAATAQAKKLAKEIGEPLDGEFVGDNNVRCVRNE
jgi:hypothetical protein|tara:strand:+ start:170 stop:379 length:210 start_codon:yes stop_codon:yes gene_type:complete